MWVMASKYMANEWARIRAKEMCKRVSMFGVVRQVHSGHGVTYVGRRISFFGKAFPEMSFDSNQTLPGVSTSIINLTE